MPNDFEMQKNGSKLAGLTLLLVILLIASCDSRAGTSDPESDRNLLLALLYSQGAANWPAACVSSQETALACANSASASAIYISALEALWNTSIPSPQGSSEICEAANYSSFFNKMSAGARSCYFRCQNSYWQEQRDQNKCSLASYTTALSSAASQTANCFADCLSEKTRFAF